ncbi:MAG: hypothetical protein M3Q69_05220 [Acidobacteriota bacterium]|nr:hypothetical protein [Acidobacteriota bacterium]
MSLTRRALIASAAAAAVTTALRNENAEAQSTPQTNAAPNAEAEARIAMVLGKYGERFTEEQKNEIRRNIRGAQSGFDAMRAYPLDNSVEPATLFRVYRRTPRLTRVRTEKK